MPEQETIEERAVQCLLCRSQSSHPVRRLTSLEIRKLWKQLGIEFSAGALGPLKDDTVVCMHRCMACGFLFFDPHLAGNASFYHELEHQGYYAPDRPEFGRTLAVAKTRKAVTVMDVGCGDGAFLDLVKAAGMVTSGIELNKSGAEKALKKGHRVFDRLLHELNVKETGLFDVISLFQVLEHVSDPIAIIKDAVRLLNPDGIIAVAVPSAEGVLRLSIWDPHLWPPHHVSLWHLRDFDTLAGLTGLVVLKKGGDRLFGSSIKQLWKGHNALAASIGKGGFLGGNILPSITSFVFRKTGMKHLFSNCGNSIYAFFVVRK